MTTIEERKLNLLLSDFAYLNLNKSPNSTVILKDIIDLEELKWYELKSNGTIDTDKNGKKIVKEEMEHDYEIAQQINEKAGDLLWTTRCSSRKRR